MKNTLSPILLALQETYASQGTAVKWVDGAEVVESIDDAGNQVWWVKQSVLDDLFLSDELEQLLDNDLLENDGKPLKKQAGRTREFAYGVRMTQLKKLAKEIEVKASGVQMAQRQVRNLERQLKAAREENVADVAFAHLLNQLTDTFGSKSAVKLKFDRTKPSKGAALAGIPTLMLSDWHWGETVDPAQIEYTNEYNLDIAHTRADRVFNKTLDLLFHNQAGQTYDGITVILAGDMLSGNIHDELRATNDMPIFPCVMSLAEKLAAGIMEMAKQFPWVYVPCVVGNHGRIDHKPTAKHAVDDNYDNLLYNIVQRIVQGSLGDKCNVEFDISTSLDMPFKLYNTRYLLTHGDQIKGGSGVGGFWPSMMKVAQRKQDRSVAVGGPAGGFDYMLCGHFHKYGNIANVIVNGSLKGYDEWVYKMNFGWERPTQALWITHPDYGITGHIPVYGDELESDARSNIHPVTPASGMRKAK